MSRGRPRSRGGAVRNWGEVRLRFSGRELLDLAVAWLVLSLAFAIFFGGGGMRFLAGDPVVLLAISAVTAGVGFILHELGHKVAAVRFDTPAEFRADYGMLGLAVVVALAGWLFAAPGAVYHPPAVTKRQQGLIALAGPAVNVVLVAAFLPLLFVPLEIAAQLAFYGVLVNAFLAAFNMIPFGPLDGRKVLGWSNVVFVLSFLLTVGLAAATVFLLFL
ncbi:MAG: metalloprotease [Halobacteriales archaeon]